MSNIIITGASRGIGRAIALALADKNNNLVLNCIQNKDLLAQVQQDIIKIGGNAQIDIGDVDVIIMWKIWLPVCIIFMETLIFLSIMLAFQLSACFKIPLLLNGTIFFMSMYMPYITAVDYVFQIWLKTNLAELLIFPLSGEM